MAAAALHPIPNHDISRPLVGGGRHEVAAHVACRFVDVIGLSARSVQIGESTVGHEWNVSLFQALAKLRTVAVPECVVHDSGGKVGVFNSKQRCRERAG